MGKITHTIAVTPLLAGLSIVIAICFLLACLETLMKTLGDDK